MLGCSLILALLLQGGAQLPPPGAIAGQVRARDGSPVVAIRVAVIPAAPPDARPEDGIQYYQDPPPAATTMTDARGHFRLPAVPAGRYVLVAGIQGRATYFPSIAEPTRATVISVGGVTRTDNLEITLVEPVGGHVRGTITPPPSSARAEIMVL
jgi:hypothetical protein